MSKLRHKESWYSRTKKELEEMDYKEKYRIALNKAKGIYEGQLGTATRIFLEQIFPELKESEDERIREGIIKFLKSNEVEGLITYEARQLWIAYLEKQKELFESGKGLYYYDGEKTTYCGSPATEQKDYRKLYEGVTKSDWFKQAYEGKSLGEEENPKEWSEEDEKKINFLSRLIEFQVKDDEYCFGDGRLISKKEAIEMLKSLRPTHWKPTEEQMRALKKVAYNLIGTGTETDIYLVQLYEQLKAIK